ncbi:MAG: hypothetical protein RIS47_1203 [Bacteroidota bacterium]|jgi:signal peptidase II
MSRLNKTFLVVFLVVLLDQVIKFWIKTSFTLGEELRFFDWMVLHFTENNGMAFGLEFGGVVGKILLTTFRIVAVSVLGWYIVRLAKEDAPMGYLLSVGLIMAGALGNIIDSTFYGLLFSESTPYELAKFLPDGGHYAPLLQGRVVDMLYFKIIDTHWPSWVPMWGGESFQFFRPVFNIADASISIGVMIILAFYRSYLRDQKLIP